MSFDTLGSIKPPARAGKRRFFQFGLRTLLFATTVFSVWLGLYVHRVRLQKAAVAAIRDSGGSVHYDFQKAPTGAVFEFNAQAEPKLPAWLVKALGEDFFYDVIEADLGYHFNREDDANSSGELFQHLDALPDLRRLVLHQDQATDESLRPVGRLAKLERLVIFGPCEVTDVGVAQLAGLTKLSRIELVRSRISDESLKTLSRLPALEAMRLQGSRLTDNGLAYLQGSQTLRSLWLGRGEGQITDAGMSYLGTLTNLAELDLSNTKVTAKGLAQLARLKKLTRLIIHRTDVADTQAFEQALPSCKIHR